MSEICGLRVCDVAIESDVPHIQLVEYNNRTLKTKNSTRDVPLVPLAVQVLSKYLTINTSKELFPTYNDGTEVSANTVSAALTKYIKTIGIRGKTTHSTRHTMRDLLRHANIPPHIIDAIGGWGANTVGASYGLGYSLQQKLDALNAALKPIVE